MIARFALVAAVMFATSAVADVPASSLARIVVPSHDIKRGDVIGDSDLVYQNVNAAAMIAGIASSMDQLDGMEARRFLRAGEALRLDDVRHPILVTKGSNVTMTFSAPGIALTETGKAMSEGGMGETVTVLNPVSYKQISAVVTGSGQVSVGDPVTNIPAQLASAQP
ncbi:MAG TPA: flagellar basal body P-ring formation chaperone FlgA [Rhizomicrobium sp.]|nr:flagellar basal body P-ring formation chaperone FlgA [Rhizomicrobium sp.]